MMELAIAALGLGVWFVVAWKFSVRVDNYSIVDAAWSLSFAPVAAWYALSLDGWWLRKLAIAVLVAAWSLRLGIHLVARISSHHPKEDRRYKMLRERWEGNLPAAFLKFYLSQALLTWLLMLPVFLICRERADSFHWLEIAGLSLWFLALAGEALADRQLSQFKKRDNEDSPVCKDGLWRYSRHPNYFFQSLLWWGLFIIALPAPYGWVAVLAPLTMLFFLLRVTGIPLTEKLSVESKGDAYREYQKNTSAFVPLPPKSSHE